MNIFDAVPVHTVLAALAEAKAGTATIRKVLDSALRVTDQGVTVVLGVEGGVCQGGSYKLTPLAGLPSIVVADYDTENADEAELVTFQSDAEGLSQSTAVISDPLLIRDDIWVTAVLNAVDAKTEELERESSQSA